MEKLYTIKEVSEYLGVHVQTIYRWIREGMLPAIQPTKRTTRIKESALKDFIESWGVSK